MEALVSMLRATAIKLRNTLVPKLLLGNPVSKALGNRSCVALPPASMQVVALRDGKLELPILNSQAGAWELALTKILNLMAVT